MLQNYLKSGYLIISREYLGQLLFAFMTGNENILKILCML